MGFRNKERGEGSKYYCDMNYPLGMEKHHFNIIWLGMTHFFGLQGWYLVLTGSYHIFIPCAIIAYFAGMGITMGCHRYWSHRTYKAKLPLQIFLAAMQIGAAQYTIFKWCRDHRLHHKYTETDADPHDARRGFYFSHIGWNFVKEHPAVKEKEALLDLSDLDNDPVIRFQTKYYWFMLPIFNCIIPAAILHYFLPELTLYQLTCANYSWYVTMLHGTFLVNSAAHMYGYRPYDTGIFATESPLLSLLVAGEGFHNYHHTFPWDYKTAELGSYGTNWSAMFIDMLAWMGLAYDLKTVPHEVVMARVKRTGDMELYKELRDGHDTFHNFNTAFNNVRETEKSQPPAEDTELDEEWEQEYKNLQNNRKALDKIEEVEKLPPWGWGDEDIRPDHFELTEIINRQNWSR